MAIKPFEIQSPSLVLAGVQMQAGTTGVVIPGVTQATTYTVEEVDDTGDQTDTWLSVPTVIDNGRYTILNGGSEPAGYTISEYVVEELDGDGYIDDIEVTEVGAFPASYESTMTQDMWATTVADPFTSFNPADWTQIPFAPQVRAGDVENVGGGSGYIIPYEVATFVANTQPGFGEIQFADSEGANSAPATAQKLFINNSPTNEQSMGTIFQQWTSNSYRGTLSLNNGSDSQATFNISNGRIYFNPETYRGFNAGLNQIWGDDCSINQLIITNATAPKFYNTDFLVEEDVFHATGLATGNTHVMLNIYGSSQYNPINPNDLWNTFVAFVDNVLYDGEDLRTDTSVIREQFYNNAGSFRNNIPTQDLYQYFRFTSSSDADYFGTAPTTTNGSGTGATVRIRVNPNNTYTVLGTALPGVGYIGGETLTVLGSDLGGVTPTNDLTILIDSVDGDGVITQISYLNGDGVYPWPTNRISDGGDDQYDVGNYLNTNLASEISYANGITQTASAAFGGGDYCVMYYQSFFCMVATGVSSSVSDLFYSGDLGFDGDGLLNWTGLRSNQDVVANNNALYAYFDSEYLDGELTPTVGTTYNMTLDSAGINLDGFYAYNDPDSNDHYFGSNTDWRLESQNQLFVQSYNEMIIQTLVNQRGIGETGPALTVQAGDGSPGQKEINAVAGNGGTVYVRGGDAGSSDGIDSLGNTGGSVNITGGVGSGNSQAGNIEINGGEGNNSGSINLRTDYGSNSSGKITLNTVSGETTNTWEFRSNGSTIFPTLTVDLHNGGNQSAQVLQFGDNTQQAIITGPTPDVTGSAQRLIIQGQRGSGTGEGGDVYLWGGDSDLYGGDIKIYAGDADNVSSGSGGYVNIAGGDGFDLGGYVSMQGGESSNGQGAPASVIGGYGQSGGFANIVGGQGYAGPGGNVNITGGTSGNGLAEYGNVNIGAGASTWTFDNTGKLTFPRDEIANTDPYLRIESGSNPRILVEDASLAGPGYLDITALNTTFNGSGNSTIKINPDAGEIVSSGNLQLWTQTGNILEQYSWTFSDTGILTLPGEGIIRSNNDTVILQSYDVANTTAYQLIVGSTGGVYLQQGSNTNWLSLFPNSGNAEITAGLGSSGGAGKNLSITAGSADQSDYYTTSGGNVNIAGGLGATNDGGGGGPGGWVNITSGASADPVGVYGNVKINTGGSNTWTFDNTGNLTLPGNSFTVNYANGTQVSIGGGGSSYGNSDVVTLLGSFGSNSISTTGNVVAGLGSFSGSFDESQASTAGLYLGYAGGTPRMMFGTGNTLQTFEIDNDGGNLRFYQPGSTKATLTSGGAFSAVGNVTGANIITAGNVAFTANSSAISFNTGAFISGNANSLTRDGSILLQPYTGAGSTFPGVIIGGAGRLIAPNGGVFQIFNSSDVTFQVAIKSTLSTAATSPITGALIIPGGAGLAGSITTGVGALLTGPTFTPLANTIAGFNSNVNSYSQVTFQNKSTGADATADIVLTADNGNDTINYGDFGIINSGYDNGTPTNSLGNIVYAADTYLYAQGNASATGQSGGNLAIGTTTAGKNVKIFAGGVDNTAIVANIANTGVTITGNLSVSGNISGNTAGFAIGYRDVPQVAASNTTIGLTDAGKHYYSTTAGNFTLTIPNNATTSFSTGTAISIVVQAAGNILVNAASGVTLYMAGNSTAANRVVGTYGMATLMKVASDTWFINGTGVS